jgi:hypothetical protein
VIADPFGSDMDEDEARGAPSAPGIAADGPFVSIPSAAPTPQIAQAKANALAIRVRPQRAWQRTPISGRPLLLPEFPRHAQTTPTHTPNSPSSSSPSTNTAT